MNPIEFVLKEQNPWWQGLEKPRVPLARRTCFASLKTRLHSTDRRATLLLGPRQVGKSTLLRQLIADLLVIHPTLDPRALCYFDGYDDRLPLGGVTLDDLEHHLPRLEHENSPRFLFLDEVTRAPEWDRWIKRKIDHNSHGQLRLIATDSAPAVLAKGGVESGQGRWDELTIEPLTFDEFVGFQAPELQSLPLRDRLTKLAAVRPFERYLSLGGFPEHASQFTMGDTDVLRRLREDTLDRAIRRDLVRVRPGIDTERIAHLFSYMAGASGNETGLQLADMLRDRGTSEQTVREWLGLLARSRLLFELERVSDSDLKRLSGRGKQSKWYACDHGLVRAFSVNAEKVEDRVYETVVFRHLREYCTDASRITYFQSKKPRKSGEIDFVVEGNTRVAIEVTRSRDAADKVSALRERMHGVGAGRGVVVYGGDHNARLDNIEVVPLREFLIDPQRYITDKET